MCIIFVEIIKSLNVSDIFMKLTKYGRLRLETTTLVDFTALLSRIISGFGVTVIYAVIYGGGVVVTVASIGICEALSGRSAHRKQIKDFLNLVS